MKPKILEWGHYQIGVKLALSTFSPGMHGAGRAKGKSLWGRGKSLLGGAGRGKNE